MPDAMKVRYRRIENSVLGPGWTTEYRGPHGHVLAYVDETATGIDVTVFDPATERSRWYGDRTPERAEGIVKRHLKREGYGFTA